MPAGDTFTQFNTQAEDEVAARVKIQAKMRSEMPSVAKGAAVGPFTMAPDMVGLAQQGFRSQAGQAALQSGAIQGGWVSALLQQGRQISGDPVRDLVGLDPESTAGMVGEVFGGWENAIAKGGTAVAKAFSSALAHNPDMVMASIGGARGLANIRMSPNFVRAEVAEARLAKGDNPATVMGDTGWFKGDDGNMKFMFSDKDSHLIDSDIIFGGIRKGETAVGETGEITYKLSDVFKHPVLYKLYPEFKDHPITFSYTRQKDNFLGKPNYRIENPAKPTTGGETGGHFGVGIAVHNDPTGDFGRGTILHEIQHKIQNYEGFSGGASAKHLQELASVYDDSRMYLAMLKDANRGTFPKQGASRFEIGSYLKELAESNGEMIGEPGVLRHYREVFDSVPSSLLKDSSPDAAEFIWEAEAAHSRILDDAVLGLEVGDQGEFLKLLEGGSGTELIDLAWRRYVAQGGEVEARIVEFFKDMDDKQIFATMKELGAETPTDLSHSAAIKHPLKEGEKVVP